jgi:hypothetical protein
MFPPPQIKMKVSHGLSSDGGVSRFLWIAPMRDYSNGEWLYQSSYGHAHHPEGTIKESWAPAAGSAFRLSLRTWLAEPAAALEAFAAQTLPQLCAAEPEIARACLDLEMTARLNVLPYKGSGPLQHGRPLYIPLDQDLIIWLPEVDEALRWSSSDGDLKDIHLDLRMLEDLWPSLIYPLAALARDRTTDVEALFGGWAAPGA